MKMFFKEEREDPNGLRVYRYQGTNYSFSYDGELDGDECYCIDDTCAPIGQFTLTCQKLFQGN